LKDDRLLSNVSNQPNNAARHFLKKSTGLILSLLALALVVGGIMIAFPRNTTTQTAKATGSGDWPTYMYSAGRGSYNQAETTINQTTAPSLKLHWSYPSSKPPIKQPIYSQPVEANGIVYWGSFDGNEYATDLNGNLIWSKTLGGSITQCVPTPLGVVGSAAVVNDVLVNNVLYNVLYVGGSDHNLYALDASTGQLLWQTLLGVPNTNTFIWDSPLVVNGNVYIGTATTGEGAGCKNVQGQLFELSASTGNIENTFDVVPHGCKGGGIWGSPTFDASDNSIYITTGNVSGQCKEPYAVGIVKLNALNLSRETSWHLPPLQREVSDADFGTTPVLFTANIGGTVHQMVGVAHKNGNFYAFDRATLRPKVTPSWTANIAITGNCPDCGQGSISPAVFDGSHLYVAGGKTTINNQQCGGSVQELDPATGINIWQACLPKTVLGAVTEVPGVIAVVDTPYMTLLDASSGAVLRTFQNHFYGSASISNGVLYVGSTSGQLSAYGV
jgi:outer membrane protein assembly factor BamB